MAKTRAYSLNSVVNWVNDKVIDYPCKCNEYAKSGTKRKGPENDIWKTEHKCSINNKGSAGSIESAGAIEIFQRSINNNKLRYNNFTGDGDSSSFNKVAQSKPYVETFIINKSECVGHIQKHLGCLLRILRQTYKGKKLSDGKKVFQVKAG